SPRLSRPGYRHTSVRPRAARLMHSHWGCGGVGASCLFVPRSPDVMGKRPRGGGQPTWYLGRWNFLIDREVDFRNPRPLPVPRVRPMKSRAFNCVRSVGRRSIALLTLAVYLSGCAGQIARETRSPQVIPTLDRAAPYLRVHYKDGRLAVFDSWGFVDANGTSIDPDDFATAGSASATSSRGRLHPPQASLRGPGTLYDTNREVIRHGEIQVAMDSLALAETNVTQIDVGRTVLLAIALVVLSVTVAYAIDCALNPKECFGSCPTFYVTDGT